MWYEISGDQPTTHSMLQSKGHNVRITALGSAHLGQCVICDDICDSSSCNHLVQELPGLEIRKSCECCNVVNPTINPKPSENWPEIADMYIKKNIYIYMYIHILFINYKPSLNWGFVIGFPKLKCCKRLVELFGTHASCQHCVVHHAVHLHLSLPGWQPLAQLRLSQLVTVLHLLTRNFKVMKFSTFVILKYKSSMIYKPRGVQSQSYH